MSIKRIKPAKQGDLNGACGFYAIVNALHALEHSLDQRELFTQVFDAFLQDGNHKNFIDGTYRGTIKNTLSRVVEYLNNEYQMYDDKTLELYEIEFTIPYWLKDTPRTRKQVIDQISQADNGKECICIVGYDHQAGGHWSVVRKVSEKGLHMFDSDQEKRIIPLSELTIDSSRKPSDSRPYNFCSADIFVIRKKWLGELLAL
tara:strand:+ start:2394 stop:2999 length:606 start_codon:yes stop_codon:yes gene_type:complete